MAASELSKKVDAHIKDMAREMGFDKQILGRYYKYYNDDTIISLYFTSLSPMVKGDRLIGLHFGVTNTRIDSIFAQCSEYRIKGFMEFTIASSIWLVTKLKDVWGWNFSKDTDIPKQCKSIRRTIEKYVYPFFEKYSDYDTLKQAVIDDKFRIPMGRGRCLAIISYLEGDYDLAYKYQDEHVTKFGYRNEVAELYDKNFRELINKAKAHEGHQDVASV